MTKASLFSFLVEPGEIVRGVRQLGLRGAAVHGIRRASAATERAFLGPAQIRINPMGAVCNHTCPMCWLQQMDPAEKKRAFREDRETGMSLDEYVAFFDGAPRGIAQVNVVGGGEPLVHPDCVGIMRDIKRRGWKGYLITNGTLIDEDTSRALVDMRWDRVRVSTHAGDAATYEKVQGVDHFERLRERLSTYDRMRRAAGVERECQLHIHNVLQRANLGTIASMFEFAATVGADEVTFELVYALAAHERLSPEELEATASELTEAAAASDIATNAHEVVAQIMREHAATVAEAEAGVAPSPSPGEGVAPPVAAAEEPPPAEVEKTLPAAVEAPPPAADEEPPPASDDPPSDNSSAEPAHPHVAVPDEAFRPAARCSVGFDSTFVNANGDVVPCCFSNELMGNVREKTFKEIWYGDRYSAFRKRLINGEFAQYCIDVRYRTSHRPPRARLRARWILGIR